MARPFGAQGAGATTSLYPGVAISAPLMDEPEGKLSQEEAERLGKVLDNRLQWGRRFWKPLHDRMDLWLNMYLLLDLLQQSKPLGFRRFVSNDPRTAVDSAVSILTRNEAFWRIDLPIGANKEERGRIGKVERALAGVVDDMDEMFLLRGDMRFWKQVAWFALMRGWVWGKFHVTKTALDLGRPAPLLAEMWDGRMVFPTHDGIGLASVLAEKHTTLAELLLQYPDKFPDIEPDSVDLNAPAIKLEFWSNTRGDREGVTCCLALYDTVQGSSGVIAPPEDVLRHGKRVWLIEPYRHGYTPEQLPVVGVPVNGIPIKSKPVIGNLVVDAMVQRADRIGQAPPSWHDPSGWVAETGRGILSSVEQNIPQYNEVMATVLQHFTVSTYGTWVFYTSSGELPEFEPGANAQIPLHIGEDVKRFEPSPITNDAYRIMGLLQDERQRGVLSNILQTAAAQAGMTGVALQQTLHTALNALEPYSTGMQDFGRQVASHILEQLKGATDIGVLSLVGRSGRSYFRLEFDPKEDLDERKYKPVPVFKPSLPEDMFIKAQTARILLDPRRPVMSLVTVLENVLQLDDPEGEIDRIFADIADLDPVIVLERVAKVLEEEGEAEIAERIREKEFQAKFIQDLQFRQMLAAAGVQQMPGPSAETGAPTATGGGIGRPGQGQAPGAPPGIPGERVTP